MTDQKHKFHIGQLVDLIPRYARSAAHGTYEIVGLVPQKALDQTAEFYLRVENFRSGMILENRLEEVIAQSSAQTARMADALRSWRGQQRETPELPREFRAPRNFAPSIVERRYYRDRSKAWSNVIRVCAEWPGGGPIRPSAKMVKAC